MPADATQNLQSTVFSIGQSGNLVPLDPEEEAYLDYRRLEREARELEMKRDSDARE